jgi:RHS repeat-associated protein
MTDVWHARNRLKEVKANGVTVATFVYDAFGRRQQKTLTDAGVTTSTITIHDGHNPVQERDGNTPSVVTAQIRTGSRVDEFFSRSEFVGANTKQRYFLTNHLGSVIALTDGSGAITKSYRYEPFGKTSSTGETSSNPYQYTGRESDTAASNMSPTGLHYYRARYYDAEMQRFISEDPIEFRGGLNFYRYVSNNPISRNDPSGLAEICFKPPAWGSWPHAFLCTDGGCRGFGPTEDGKGMLGSTGAVDDEESGEKERSFCKRDDGCNKSLMDSCVRSCPPLPRYNPLTSNCADWALNCLSSCRAMSCSKK